MSNRSSTSRRAALRAQQEAEARRKRTNRIIMVVAAVLGAVVIGIVALVVVQQLSKSATGEQITPPNATAEFGIRAYPDVTPKEGAPTVVVWEDPQCPWCKTTNDYYGKNIHALAKKGDIVLEYRVVSFLDKQLRNSYSIKAARGATIADKYGKFVEYMDAVYKTQPQREGNGWTDAQFRQDFPAKIGLTGDQLAEFQKLWDEGATDAFVTKTTDKWMTDKIPGTPAIYVNGTKVEPWGQDANGKTIPAWENTEAGLLKVFTG